MCLTRILILWELVPDSIGPVWIAIYKRVEAEDEEERAGRQEQWENSTSTKEDQKDHGSF